MLECRFYNMIIFRDKRIVHVNEYFKDGILFVHQLWMASTLHGHRFPCVRSIPNRNYRHRMKTELAAWCSGTENKLWSSVQNGNKRVFLLMSGSDALPADA